MTLWSAVLLLAGTTGLASPPNGELRVAYRQLEGGRPSEVFWESTLSCGAGACSLTHIAFGGCVNWGTLGRIWFPGVRTVKTETGELVITKVDTNSLEAQERGLGTTITYRWSFTTAVGSSKAHSQFGKLTSFSASAVHADSRGQNTWEFMPFKGELVKIPLACELAVAGVPE
jgi:hypothetical protein